MVVGWWLFVVCAGVGGRVCVWSGGAGEGGGAGSTEVVVARVLCPRVFWWWGGSGVGCGFGSGGVLFVLCAL